MRPVALVTGASAGIGAEFARALARRGYDLVLVARRRDRLDALAADVVRADAAVSAHVIAADLTEPGAAASIAERVRSDGLTIDLLVNNAGFGSHGAFVSVEPERVSGQIALNVASLVDLTRTFLPGMVERRRGGVINVASTAAFQPVPAMAVYGATKAFVLSFSEALHEEVRRSGVRVLALCPGATETEFFSIAGEDASIGMRRSSESVVRTALRAYQGRRAVAIDGFANAALANGVRFMPRAVVARLAARMMGAH